MYLQSFTPSKEDLQSYTMLPYVFTIINSVPICIYNQSQHSQEDLQSYTMLPNIFTIINSVPICIYNHLHLPKRIYNHIQCSQIYLQSLTVFPYVFTIIYTFQRGFTIIYNAPICIYNY